MVIDKEIENMIKTINVHATSYRGGKKIESQVLLAMKQVHRHKFVSDNSYQDTPVQIGYNQTISQPFIVAYMTDKLQIHPTHKVLEIGTGSGYQAAILSKLCSEVYTIERIKELSDNTQLKQYNNIKTKVGNGVNGWNEYAPYDRIMVTAMAESIPPLLLEQLTNGGKMLIPIQQSGDAGELKLITKKNKTYSEKSLIEVRFVPLINDIYK